MVKTEDENTAQPRANFSRTQSRKSGRGSRPGSLRSPGSHLARLRSGSHLDDQSHYHEHGEDYFSDHEEDAVSDIEPEDASQDTVNRDLEAGPRLEKSKSTRSIQDPNLVKWSGKDDPENPKNWTMGRKWAATFIGKSMGFPKSQD